MRSRSGIESAFIPRSWRSLVQPRMGAKSTAGRRQPQGVPNEPTIISSPRGGGHLATAGRVAAGAGWPGRNRRFPGFGVGRLPFWLPSPRTHRICTGNVATPLTRTLRCTLPFQLSMALVALFLPTATLASRTSCAAPVCMILMISWKLAREQEQSIGSEPTTLTVFPAVPDHSRPQVRSALSRRPRLGFGSRGLVVRSLTAPTRACAARQ